jgi:hypothetical protein
MKEEAGLRHFRNSAGYTQLGMEKRRIKEN